MSRLLKKFDTFNEIKLPFPSVSAAELKMRLYHTLKSPFVLPGCISRTVAGLDLKALSCSTIPAVLYWSELAATCGAALVLQRVEPHPSFLHSHHFSLAKHQATEALPDPACPVLKKRKQFWLKESLLIQDFFQVPLSGEMTL